MCVFSEMARCAVHYEEPGQFLTEEAVAFFAAGLRSAYLRGGPVLSPMDREIARQFPNHPEDAPAEAQFYMAVGYDCAGHGTYYFHWFCGPVSDEYVTTICMGNLQPHLAYAGLPDDLGGVH